jgi:hypothetical protein
LLEGRKKGRKDVKEGFEGGWKGAPSTSFLPFFSCYGALEFLDPILKGRKGRKEEGRRDIPEFRVGGSQYPDGQIIRFGSILIILSQLSDQSVFFLVTYRRLRTGPPRCC